MYETSTGKDIIVYEMGEKMESYLKTVSMAGQKHLLIAAASRDLKQVSTVLLIHYRLPHNEGYRGTQRYTNHSPHSFIHFQGECKVFPHNEFLHGCKLAIVSSHQAPGSLA